MAATLILSLQKTQMNGAVATASALQTTPALYAPAPTVVAL